MQNNSAVVRRFIEETINQGQIDSAVQFAWEDIVEQVPFPGFGYGLRGRDKELAAQRCAGGGHRLQYDSLQNCFILRF
jgi:hypothetical protein